MSVILRLFIGFLLLIPIVSHAKTKIIFVNGIGNTLGDANKSREKIIKILNETSNYFQRKQFDVYSIYNPIGYNFSNISESEEDRKELFVLKSAEEEYKESIKIIINPHYKNNTNEYYIKRNAAAKISTYVDTMVHFNNEYTKDRTVKEKHMETSKKVVRKLASIVSSFYPNNVIIIAHSEGNLIANLAYSYAINSENFNSDLKIEERTRIINVANTSEFSINKLNITHDKDNVIYDIMRTLPVVFAVHRDYCKELDHTCPFTLSKPTFTGISSILDFSPLGHGFLSIYTSGMDVFLTEEGDKQNVQFTPNANTFKDRIVDLIYTADNSFNGGTKAEFTKVSNGQCVVDNNTGLMWDNKTDGTASGHYYWKDIYADKNCPISEKTYCNAYSYVQLFNNKSWCGYKDWRLPTEKELLTIVKNNSDNGCGENYAVDKNFFTYIGSEAQYYITSTNNKPDNIGSETYSSVYFGCINSGDTRVYPQTKKDNPYVGIVLVRD